MANIETEQNAPVETQRPGDQPSASVALCEENLEALLKAVSGGAAPVPGPREQALPSSMVSSAPVNKPAEPSAEPAAEKSLEGEAQPEVSSSAQEEQVRQAGQVQPEDAGPIPAAASPSPAAETVPAGAQQQDVFSKLALISSIKQRRATTTRPESSTPAGESAAPAAPPREPAAGQNAAAERSSEEAGETATAPASRAAAPENVRLQEKPAFPEKKANSPDAAQHHVAQEMRSAKGAAAHSTPSPIEMFASLETSRTNASTGKLKSFAASKAGLGMIAVVILGAAVTVFFLTGRETKTATNAPGPTVTASAQAASTAAPVVPSVTGKSSEENPSTGKPPAATAAAASPHSDVPASTKQETAQAAKPAIPQPTAVQPPAAAVQQQPAATGSPRTIARTFAPPEPAAHPASNPILDAPPALATTATAPAAVALPARIASLPPPAAPAAAANNAGQPRQITVAGKTQAAKLAREVLPVYPALAKSARVQGIVRFRVTIGADGQIKGLTTLGGPAPLVPAARDAVSQWRYQPTLVGGEPVEVITEVDVAFTL